MKQCVGLVQQKTEEKNQGPEDKKSEGQAKEKNKDEDIIDAEYKAEDEDKK